MLAMLLTGMAVDTDVVMDGYDTLEIVSDLVHVYFRDVLVHLQAKRHAQESIPSLLSVENCQVWALLIKVHTSEASLASSFKNNVALLDNGKFHWGLGFVMLTDDDLVEVLGDKAELECAVWFLGFRDDTHSINSS